MRLGLSSHGIAAEQEVWRRAVSAMPGIRHDVQEAFVDGDAISARVVVTGRLDGEFAGTVSPGRSFQIDRALFVHLRHGKAAEVREIVDSGALREQLSAP
jgi:predicted ester cyclase